MCYCQNGNLIVRKKISNHFYEMFLVSVNTQSLEVTPDPAIGDLGGSIDIIWTITKVEPTDRVINTRLYIGTDFNQENVLYYGLPPLTKADVAKTFGGRIKVTFDDPKFKLTLSNLNFKDTVTFTLVISTEDDSFNSRPNSIKSIKITEVRGEEIL